MGRRGKGEGQRTTGRSKKRGHGWGRLRFFCLLMWVRFCSEDFALKKNRERRETKRKKSGEEKKKKKKKNESD